MPRHPYLNSSKEYNDYLNLCLCPKESVSLMKAWCTLQNIDKHKFRLNILKCTDKSIKNHYLCGELNSGKTYITMSIQKATFFYREVNQGTASYNFMWQDCINKRIIIMNCTLTQL